MTTTLEPGATRLGDPTQDTAPDSRRQALAARIITHICIIIGVIMSVFPFYWLVVMSTRTTAEIFSFPPKFLPGTNFDENMTGVLQSVDLFRSMLYSFLVSAAVAILVMFFDSLAGYTFAKYNFPGKNALFVILMVTFLIPGSLSLVPSFVLMGWLGWIGSFESLIIPGAANAFGIFLLRQFAQASIPDELLDAAKVDGSGFFRTWWSVGVPMMRGGLLFLGIFTFIGTWNDYVWPLIVLVDPERQTLQVALSTLFSIYRTDYGMVMAGAVVSVIPLIGIFIIGSRHFIANIAAGALKG